MKKNILFLFTFISLAMLYSVSSFANPVFWSPTTNSGLNPSFSIVLSPDAGAATYTIEVWSDPTYSTAPVQSQTGAARNYTATGLTYGATYYLRGRSNVSTAGYYALKTVTISNTIAESIPTIANGTILNSNPTFYTSAVGNGTNYEFQFDTVATFNSSSLIDVNSASTNVTLTRYQLKSGMTYYIRVRPTAGSVGNWTTAPNVKHFVAELKATTFSSPTTGSTMNRSGFKLWVNKVANATGYDIQISTDFNFGTVLYTLSPPDANVNPGYFVYDYAGKPGESALNYSTQYYFRVRAKNASQTSPYSSYIGINTGTPAVNLTNVVNGTTYNPTYTISAALASGNVTSYTLQLSTSATFNTNLIYNVTQAGRVFDISGVTTRGVTLYARARINGLSFTGTVYNFVINATPTATISSPANGATIAHSVNFYTASNFAPASLTYYYEADVVNTFNSGSLIQTNTTNAQGGTPLALAKNTTYYVRARVKINSNSVYSAWSPVITVHTNSLRLSDVQDESSAALTTTATVTASPNPFTDYVNVRGNGDVKVTSVMALDLTGKAIMLDATDRAVNTSVLNRGIYMLQIGFEDGTTSRLKVVKE